MKLILLGFSANRMLSILLVIGTVYRVIAFGGLIFLDRAGKK